MRRTIKQEGCARGFSTLFLSRTCTHEFSELRNTELQGGQVAFPSKQHLDHRVVEETRARPKYFAFKDQLRNRQHQEIKTVIKFQDLFFSSTKCGKCPVTESKLVEQEVVKSSLIWF